MEKRRAKDWQRVNVGLCLVSLGVSLVIVYLAHQGVR